MLLFQLQWETWFTSLTWFKKFKILASSFLMHRNPRSLAEFSKTTGGRTVGRSSSWRQTPKFQLQRPVWKTPEHEPDFVGRFNQAWPPTIPDVSRDEVNGNMLSKSRSEQCTAVHCAGQTKKTDRQRYSLDCRLHAHGKQISYMLFWFYFVFQTLIYARQISVCLSLSLSLIFLVSGCELFMSYCNNFYKPYYTNNDSHACDFFHWHHCFSLLHLPNGKHTSTTNCNVSFVG